VVSAVEAALAVAAARAAAGKEMRTKEFLNKLEHDRIVRAIQEAESKSSGQIRVYIQRGKLDVDPLPKAHRKFHQMGMQKTNEHNAVLVFVAPRARKLAVVGDRAIHEKCGEEFWHEVVDRMRDHFREEKFTQALVEAITEIGNMLAAHFPRRSISSNELPDEIIED
jgi:uncharacterized membrane protein